MRKRLQIDGQTYKSVEAEIMAAALCLTKTALRPKAERDDARQAGTHKERRPEINEWIAKQLKRDPDAKAPALYERAPGEITEQITTLGAFGKRVTKVRKLRLK